MTSRCTFPGLSTNARLVHRFSRGGKYCVKVRGFSGQGGPDRVYELRITPGEYTRCRACTRTSKPYLKSANLHACCARTGWQELARRGGASRSEQAVEIFHAVAGRQLPKYL